MRSWRNNPNIDLENLRQIFELEPTLENRSKLIRAAASMGQIEYLNNIFKGYEQPVLDLIEELRSGKRRHYSISDGIFEQFFEKIYPELPWRNRSLEHLIDYEQHREAHLVSEVKFNIPRSNAAYGRPYPAREKSVSFFRTPEASLLRILDRNLDDGTFLVDYLEKTADKPMFGGWQRFLDLKGETWDVPVETGAGGATEEEQQLISRLGYYGEEINEESIAGLEAGKHFSELQKGSYRFSIEALDGKSETWFQTRQEAIDHAKQYPGLRLGATSWLDEMYGDRKFFIETYNNEDPLTYDEIFS